MKTQLLITSVLLAISGAIATPTPVGIVDLAERAVTPTETQILQFALTLEHLENAFYTEGLKKYNQSAFRKAGYLDWVRNRFTQIAMHEKTHVQFLTAVLGNNAPKPCKYKFPLTDPRMFATISANLEGVGTSAYLGGAQYLSTPEVLVAAGSILATEARQAAWVLSSALKGAPWSGSFQTALTGSQALSLASSFIVPGSCPASNPSLPFKTFAALALNDKSPTPGPNKTIKLKFKDPNNAGAPRYLAFLSGLATTFVEITKGKEVFVPFDVTQGVVYAVVTSSNEVVTDENTIAGPMIFNFPYPSGA